jgi:hypothetical protein
MTAVDEKSRFLPNEVVQEKVREKNILPSMQTAVSASMPGMVSLDISMGVM